MNRELIVKLLHKDIKELEMITSGFMEMNIYPNAIMLLAKQKTEDILLYLQQLSSQEKEVNQSAEIYLDLKTSQTAEDIKAEKILVDEIDEEDEIDEIDEEENTEEETAEEVKEEYEIELEIIEKDKQKTVDPITTKSYESSMDYSLSNLIENKVTSEYELKTPEIETKIPVFVEKNIVVFPSRNELLSQPEKTISSSLANKKITDIKQAISIGDRFRFQRELFRGNGEDMNKTFTYINLLATQEEALSFLKSKYGWATDNETAEDFLQIVRRRFL